MAIFCYVHPETNAVVERHFPCGKARRSVMIAGVRHERSLGAECAGQGGQQPSTWPMVSRALGVHPEQVKEYSEFAGQHGVATDYDQKGNPIFNSKRHRKQYCELVGATDLDGGYGDPCCA